MRKYGYAGYHRQLEFDQLAGLEPVDYLDASQLRAGTHRVRIGAVRYYRVETGETKQVWVEVRLDGPSRRHAVYYCPADEWRSRYAGSGRGATGPEVGSVHEARIEMSDGFALYRNQAGSYVVISDDSKVAGIFATVAEARDELPISELVVTQLSTTEDRE